jgi:5-methyltetrahydrofolate--homocysteine methyltransferase
MDDILAGIAENVILGRRDKSSMFPEEKTGEPGVEELTQQAVESGMATESILNDGLLAGMDVVGQRFKGGEVYIPEVMRSSEALKAGMELLKPLMVASGLESNGKVVLGSVKGDLHDIGKNLVSMMLKGARLEVVDLGVDVSAESFIESIRKENAQVLALSSLLTTTMMELKTVIDALKEAGLRDQVKVLVGGAPVTQDFADDIGADGYAADAVLAMEKAKELLG